MAQAIQSTSAEVPPFYDRTLHYFWGNADTRSYRRRLLFIERHFCKDELSPSGYSAFLTAAFTATKNDHEAALRANPNDPDPPNPNNLGWLPYGTRYLSNRRYSALLERASGMSGRTVDFIANKISNNFSVIVSSLLYLYETVDQDDVRHYFAYEHRRHLGCHVYLDTYGCLNTLSTFIDRYEDYRASKWAPISAIYPVIALHLHVPQPTPHLTYGLMFDIYSNRYRTGSRYYHRFNEERLRAGNVNEINESILSGFKDNSDRRFYAFYVCAGAKLVVIDEYQASESCEHHNRTLVQQGGIVIFRGKLLNFTNNVHIARVPGGTQDSFGSDVYLWHDFRNKFVTRADGSKLPDIKRTPYKMIFFLGAIDSEENTISWQITVQRKTNVRKSKPKKLWTDYAYVLTCPMGARFEAVVREQIGIDEIRARIKYEVLHDSVVTNHGTDFAVPDTNQMVRNILNINPRSLYVVDDDPLIAQNIDLNMPLHKVFNLSKGCDITDDQIKIMRNSMKSRLAVPPMYPPILIKNSPVLCDGYYIPSKEKQIEVMESCYGYTQNDIKIKINDRDYKYLRLRSQAYHYKREEGKQSHDSYKYSTGHFKGTIDQNVLNFEKTPVPHRIGADGWLWWKCTNDPIYQERITCLVPQSAQSQRQQQAQP